MIKSFGGYIQSGILIVPLEYTIKLWLV